MLRPDALDTLLIGRATLDGPKQPRLHTPWLAKENENYLPGEWPCLNSHLQVLGRGHLGPSPTPIRKPERSGRIGAG